MKHITSSFEYKVYESSDELSIQDNELMQMAIAQLENAYAPYSNFHVGAAVRLVNGEIFIGSNQENASYPLCMCGERVALYNAAANTPKVAIESLAITIKNQKMAISKPVSPCGACRQVISEFENRHNHAIRILLKSDSPEIYELKSVADILPLGFNKTFL
ncbi:MAG: cytidine deaminase [Saprospiraceae bacterium]|jgi:cytidine deaminase